MKKSLFLLLLTAILLSTCKSKKKFPDFDSEGWKWDKKACEGKREGFYKASPSLKADLKGTDDDDLTDIFGTPEKTFYYGRGRKDYVYFITPGSQCNSNYAIEGKELVIEIDALGFVNIATEQQGK